MSKGGSSGSSTTTNNIPAELSGLTTQSADTIGELQTANPVSSYLGDNPVTVAPLSGTTQASLDLLNQSLSDASTPLENSAIVNAGTNYFNHSVAPGITNQATLSGLGRSTANTNALAAAQGQVMLPLLQGEQARRDALIGQGLSAGDIERAAEQEGYNATYADFLRQQGLAEQALYATMPTLPSTLGSSTVSSSQPSGGGMSAICSELFRQGLMDAETLIADTRFGESLPEAVIRGYHLWAKPLVRLMRKSPFVTRMIAPIGLAWANEMKRRVTGEGKGSRLGALMLKFGAPVCGWMGRHRPVDFAQTDTLNTPEKVKARDDVIRLSEDMLRCFDNGSLVDNFDKQDLDHLYTPINKKYGCGTYTRVLRIPKGNWIIGKIHRHECINFLLSGQVRIAVGTERMTLTAPAWFVSEAGLQKAAYAETDVAWATVHPTRHIGIENLEKAENEIAAESYAEIGLLSSPSQLGRIEGAI